jgi:uncharacterized protein (TIGR02452 family)
MLNPFTNKPLSKQNLINIDIFNDTQAMVASLPIPASTYYPSGDTALPLPSTRYQTEIKVTNQRTVEAAQASQSERAGILNFASATRVGGGVTTGSTAQEEAICRVSNLYNALLDCRKRGWYYIKPGDGRYTDNIIYTKGVTVVKTDSRAPQALALNAYWKVDVITCAAPNQRNMTLSEKKTYDLFKQRIAKVLKVFALQGTIDIVLGAWGCGAFRNPPKIVAQAFKDLLDGDYKGVFRKINFAVYATREDDDNLMAFRNTFKRTNQE